jgi:hypothetical protein
MQSLRVLNRNVQFPRSESKSTQEGSRGQKRKGQQRKWATWDTTRPAACGRPTRRPRGGGACWPSKLLRRDLSLGQRRPVSNGRAFASLRRPPEPCGRRWRPRIGFARRAGRLLATHALGGGSSGRRVVGAAGCDEASGRPRKRMPNPVLARPRTRGPGVAACGGSLRGAGASSVHHRPR